MHFIDLYKKSLLLLLLRGGSLFLTLGISLFISNIYGAKTTGAYYLFISILTGLSVISKFGLDNSLVKYVSQHCKINEAHFIRGIWYHAIKISILLCLLITLLISIGISTNIVALIPSLDNKTLIFIIICLIPFTIFGLNIATIRGLNNLLTASFFESLLFPGIFIIILTLLYLNAIPDSIFSAYIVTSLLLMITTIIYLYKLLTSATITEIKNKDDLLKTSYPIFGINFLNFISSWGATFILAAYTSLESIGIYNINWRIIAITSIFTLVFNNINAPIYSKKFKTGNISDIEHLSRNTSILLTIIGLPITIIFILFAEPILSLFGNDFIEGALILKILALGQFVSFMTGSVGYLLLMTGHEKRLRKVTLYVTTTQVSLYIIFVPMYDITAAAIITSGAIAARNLLATYIAYKHLGIISLPIPYTKNRISS